MTIVPPFDPNHSQLMSLDELRRRVNEPITFIDNKGRSITIFTSDDQLDREEREEIEKMIKENKDLLVVEW